jgi:hypothetical protein
MSAHGPGGNAPYLMGSVPIGPSACRSVLRKRACLSPASPRIAEAIASVCSVDSNRDGRARISSASSADRPLHLRIRRPLRDQLRDLLRDGEVEFERDPVAPPIERRGTSLYAAS